MARLELVSRDLTAVDGAPVTGAAVPVSGVIVAASAGFQASTTGTPTTWDARAAIEASADGGVSWHQVVRFADITNAATAARLVRVGGIGAAAEVAVAASALGSAAASGTVVDTPWPGLIRVVTKLQTLTGGTAPHVLFTVSLEVE